MQEQIPLDVYTLVQVLRSFMNRGVFELTHIMVLTSYNAQLTQTWAVLQLFLPDLFVSESGQHLVLEITSTVTIS